jgi:nucleotide-binding universal stress UspA family protein
MAVKSVLSVIGVAHSGGDLFAAAEICMRASAQLHGMVISCVPPPPLGELVGQQENDKVQDRAGELHALLGEKGLQADVEPVYCIQSMVDEEVADRALFADLVLIGDDMLKDGYLLKRVLDGALFQSPAPVILSARSRPIDLAPRTVLVAWNSTLEASIALRQAMDLLVQAGDVHVVLVDPKATRQGTVEEPGADVASFLARHGVKTTVDVLASGGRDISNILQQHASDIDAQLIVMGAYSHSRIREWIFGGTTQSMLEHIAVPVMMAR